MALCMEVGTCVSAGRRRSRVESMRAHPAARVSLSNLVESAANVSPGIEGEYKRRSRASESKQVQSYFPVDLSSPIASNGSGCSLLPCLIRISTLPSAASSSCRQEFDNCTPSSNSFNDCSSDRSPPSSCSTIFSSCRRQSSNLGKVDLQEHCRGN